MRPGDRFFFVPRARRRYISPSGRGQLGRQKHEIVIMDHKKTEFATRELDQQRSSQSSGKDDWQKVKASPNENLALYGQKCVNVFKFASHS